MVLALELLFWASRHEPITTKELTAPGHGRQQDCEKKMRVDLPPSTTDTPKQFR
jgi:hypothetical protein